MRRLLRTGLLMLVAVAAALPCGAAETRRFGLSVVVDGAVLPEYPWRERTYIEASRGQSFSLRVSNPTSQRIAVALSVDGRNVVDARRTAAGDAAKWILSPGQTVDIPGWQISGETARRFFFTDTARSYAKWLGDTANVGTIEAVFYRERRPLAISAVPVPPSLESSHQGQRDREEPSAAAGAPVGEAGGAVDSKAQGSRKSALPRSDESENLAATGIGQKTSFPITWVDFDEEKAPIARVALRYEFRRELVRLGILSVPEDLSTRDRARGFEPEYAPDPYRHRAQ